MVPANDEKIGRADGEEMQDMATVQHKPGAAPAPQARKTVYNRKTGEAVSGLYAVDAREYVRTGNYTFTPPNASRKQALAAKDENLKVAPSKPETGKGPVPIPESEKKAADPAPETKPAPGGEDFVATDESTRPATWEDWSTRQLRAVGKEVSVVNVDDLGRPEVIKALEDAGVEPKDERPEVA